LILSKKKLALRISRVIFKEKKSINSFNAYQCICSYLADLSLQELINIAEDYGVEVSKGSIVEVKNIGG